MDPDKVLRRFYSPASRIYEILVIHSQAVCERALTIAGRLGPAAVDMDFIREAAMLHDIGVFMTDMPWLSYRGGFPYICHGYLGGLLLLEEAPSFAAHARVCERHVGAGLSAEAIGAGRLPLPERDMLPKTLAEEIICFADLFFSKHPGALTRPKQPAEVAEGIRRRDRNGTDEARFYRWLNRFGI